MLLVFGVQPPGGCADVHGFASRSSLPGPPPAAVTNADATFLNAIQFKHESALCSGPVKELPASLRTPPGQHLAAPGYLVSHVLNGGVCRYSSAVAGRPATLCPRRNDLTCLA